MDDILAFVHLIDDSCCTWSLCNFASCFCSDLSLDDGWSYQKSQHTLSTGSSHL